MTVGAFQKMWPLLAGESERVYFDSACINFNVSLLETLDESNACDSVTIACQISRLSVSVMNTDTHQNRCTMAIDHSLLALDHSSTPAIHVRPEPGSPSTLVAFFRMIHCSVPRVYRFLSDIHCTCFH